MTSTMFTIGFTKKSAEEFFRLLQDARVRKLIDIRENRVGQLAGFAKYPDLAFFLDRVAGIAYDYQPILAPSPEIRDAYRRTRDWTQYEKSFLELMKQRRVLEAVDPSLFEGKVALLCSEAEADNCHRRLVAEMLVQHWSSQGHAIEVKHLQSPKRRPHKK
ncbi:MAG TPA: DUF488 domain-containing protein [Terriglobia bacterium]|nr:DUF488 domain-containing protein [Terriglobia bacterium]